MSLINARFCTDGELENRLSYQLFREMHAMDCDWIFASMRKGGKGKGQLIVRTQTAADRFSSVLIRAIVGNQLQ